MPEPMPEPVELPEPAPRRGRRSPKKSAHRVALRAGDVRSDPDLDTTLRELTRAHWHNEPAVVAIMQHIDRDSQLVAPAGAGQAACDAAFRLLQLHDNTEGRAHARAVLVDLADDGDDPIEAVTTLLHFTRAIDAQSRAAVTHAMLLCPSHTGPDRVLAKVNEVGAMRACGSMMFGAAVHMAFGITRVVPDDWAEDARTAAENIENVLKWVVVQADRLDAGYSECPLIEYDLGAVQALATLVCALDDPDDLCRQLFAMWLEISAVEFESTIERSRHRKSYRHTCDQIMTVCRGPQIRWTQW